MHEKGLEGKEDSSSLGRQPHPPSYKGISEAGKASRDAPTPKSPTSHTDPLPGPTGSQEVKGTFPCGPQCPICTMGELGEGGYTGPLVLG